MKLNVHSGSISPLCQDPLCRHTADSGCHFFGAVSGTIYQYGGKLYFQRRYQSAAGVVSYVIGYDPEDQSEKSLYEITGGGGMGFSLGYFWRSYEDENGDKISLRVDLAAGKLETLDEKFIKDRSGSTESSIFIRYIISAGSMVNTSRTASRSVILMAIFRKNTRKTR